MKYSLVSSGNLFRLVAEKDFSEVRKGDFGSLVSDEVRVLEETRAFDEAQVSGQAHVSSEVQVSEETQAFDEAQVSSQVQVFSQTRVYG